MFFCCPFDALGGTMATYAGQNVGAKKLDRVKEGLKAAKPDRYRLPLIAFVILLLGGKHIALLFMDADQTGDHRSCGDVPDRKQYVLHSTDVCECGPLYDPGMGFSTFAILAGVCEMAARSLVGFCLVPVFGFLPACFAGIRLHGSLRMRS